MSFRTGTVYVGDCIEVMRTWPGECVHCVVTSPRRRRTGGQIVLEITA